MSEPFVPTPPHTCKYCGRPTWHAPADQFPPMDFCLSVDHGSPPPRQEVCTGEIGHFDDWGIWCDDGKKQGWMKDIYGHPALFSEEKAKSLSGVASYLTPKKIRITYTVIEE
jgi:hypothetical protein